MQTAYDEMMNFVSTSFARYATIVKCDSLDNASIARASFFNKTFKTYYKPENTTFPESVFFQYMYFYNAWMFARFTHEQNECMIFNLLFSQNYDEREFLLLKEQFHTMFN